MKSITNLFQNKKSRLIVIGAIVLILAIAMMLMLIAISSNSNKKFSTKDEMLSYMEGIYAINGIEYFYVFEGDELIKIDTDCCYRYIEDYLKESNDAVATKNLNLRECDTAIKEKYGEKIEMECFPEKGKIVIYPSDFANGIIINIKKQGFEAEGNEITISKENFGDNKTNFADYYRFSTFFEEAKEKEYSAHTFLGGKSDYKEKVLANPRTKGLINQNPVFKEINGVTKYSFGKTDFLLMLGQATTSGTAKIMAEDDKNGFLTKLTLTNDYYISYENLMALLDLYLEDWPLYSAGNMAHNEIKRKMQEPESKFTPEGETKTAEFDLYGIHFYTIVQYKPEYVYYYISAKPKAFKLADAVPIDESAETPNNSQDANAQTPAPIVGGFQYNLTFDISTNTETTPVYPYFNNMRFKDDGTAIMTLKTETGFSPLEGIWKLDESKCTSKTLVYNFIDSQGSIPVYYDVETDFCALISVSDNRVYHFQRYLDE